jgi:HSP20 family protein
MALLERRSSLAPERWEPFLELDQMVDRLRRMLDETFAAVGLRAAPAAGAVWSPLVDLEETDDAYVVEVELPGVRREDVRVEMVGNELVVTGEVKERERKGVLRRQTRRRGRFEYRVSLSDEVQRDRVEASLADGVLTVRLPKAEQAPRREIPITVR